MKEFLCLLVLDLMWLEGQLTIDDNEVFVSFQDIKDFFSFSHINVNESRLTCTQLCKINVLALIHPFSIYILSPHVMFMLRDLGRDVDVVGNEEVQKKRD